VLEKVPRLLNTGKLKWDYVATRSLFPKTFGAAVKQKTRWIYGITMQSLHIKDILSKENKLSPVQKWALYKDWKSKFVNILVLPAYIILVYFLVSLFVPLPAVYPMWSLSWWLSLGLTFVMLYKQFMRGLAIYHVYGLRSVIAACLVPPVLPLRLIWGNFINFTATARAWIWYFFGLGTGKAKQTTIKWSKTEHEFLEQHVLYTYYRNLGDVLLEKQYIEPEALQKALQKAHAENRRIGEVLLENGYVNEEMLARALFSKAWGLQLWCCKTGIAPPPRPPRAAINRCPCLLRSTVNSPFTSRIIVPTGTRIMRSSPFFPCWFLPRPCSPALLYNACGSESLLMCAGCGPPQRPHYRPFRHFHRWGRP